MTHCPNSGSQILRWPYYQNLAEPGATYGHCPRCMMAFRVGKNVPKHTKGENG